MTTISTGSLQEDRESALKSDSKRKKRKTRREAVTGSIALGKMIATIIICFLLCWWREIWCFPTSERSRHFLMRARPASNSIIKHYWWFVLTHWERQMVRFTTKDNEESLNLKIQIKKTDLMLHVFLDKWEVSKWEVRSEMSVWSVHR